MSQNIQPAPEEENPDTPPKTPLELVREQQAMEQSSREVEEQRPNPSPEVPGQSSPSNIRKHPQRQLG